VKEHIIVLPGGGYQRHADHEGEPVAAWLRGLGYDASVLAYPVGVRHPAPLESVRAEVRRVRSSGADRIGLLGFSAGGHLAGHAALTAGIGEPERVDFAVLCYPVVSMLEYAHSGSRDTLLGPDSTDDERAATSLQNLVTEDAPPLFIWHTAEDASVPVQNAYLLGTALADRGVPHELHVFPTGRHGLGFAPEEPLVKQWPVLCAAWLHEVHAGLEN
jgi:acetyl esterase/lipase